MEKKIVLLICLISFTTYAPEPFPHLRPKPEKHIQITSEDVHKNHRMMFQKEYPHFATAYKKFKAELDNFYNELKKYDHQELEHQKKYENFDKLVQMLQNVHQKHLVIGISKLLQYKKGARGTEELAKTDEQLAALKKYIAEIEAYVEKMAIKKEFLEAYFTSKELSREMPIAQHFKNVLLEEFFFKIKKIKRSLTNWYSKLFTYSPGTSPATK